MDAERFEELVDEAMAELPERFAGRMENVDVIVRSRPPRKTLRQMGIGPRGTLLGLYEGIPQTRRTTAYGAVMPDRIIIFREPILDEADAVCPPDASDEEFDEAIRLLVRETVLHEIGHHFGLSEEDLRSIDYE